VGSGSYTQQRHGSNASSIQLPALSTLASIASTSPTSQQHQPQHHHQLHSNHHHTTINDNNDNLNKDTVGKQKMESPPRYVKCQGESGVVSGCCVCGRPIWLAPALSCVLAPPHLTFPVDSSLTDSLQQTLQWPQHDLCNSSACDGWRNDRWLSRKLCFLFPCCRSAALRTHLEHW
jgi:hypothetical protein